MDFELPLSRKDAVVQQLRDEILSGALAPRAAIKDAELAARLGVSVTPVREAITQLISEGFIEALPNKRRRVAALTQKQAIDLMDVLGAVFVAGLERADGKLSDEWLEDFKRSVADFGAALGSGDMQTSGPAFGRIVKLVFDAAGNDELHAVMDQVMLRSLRRIQLYPSQHLLPLWSEAFSDVADLLTIGKHAAAVDRMRRFFAELVAAMHRDRNDEELVGP
ncbi:GntR family transcriptional regulator [Arthrobacter crystallopoietes]|jgi:DNA-binding GntR family transcriptional regulator|uniref:GntR family transcriptional regulator n=1 Tax=Crystallibacter crystallopoietes TaxID=37928 RepID=UPI00148722E7|nr:GntR family transcriptional regulator [Arthrobacter crystallopoietes]QTG81317.1 GntR family transcriptional regulator [Arthrobacter crystallopoietes]